MSCMSRSRFFMLCMVMLANHILAHPFSLSLPDTIQALNLSSSNGNGSNPLTSTYTYDIPNSPVTLHYGFGGRRTSLDPTDLLNLLLVSQSCAQQGIVRWGGNHAYTANDGHQDFSYDRGDGIEVSIQNTQFYFTWQDLADVLCGLRTVLVDRSQPYQTSFYFQKWGHAFGNGVVHKLDASVEQS